MTRSETTKLLSKLTEKHINPNDDSRIYWAKEITFDYATTHAIRVDYMQFKPINNTVSGIEHGDFYCFEVKSSVDDFHSKNGHNFIGDFNYYVMPEDVYNAVEAEIPYGIGVYIPTTKMNELRVIRYARRNRIRKRSLAEMLFMMYRSAARDICKIRRKKAQEAAKT